MKVFGKNVALSLFALLLAAPVVAQESDGAAADALKTRAVCVGGKWEPSYAFRNSQSARNCRSRIARQGGSCSRSVRLGTCTVYRRASIDRVRPSSCTCNSLRFRDIGSWWR
jgi:hypothetical protein